MWKGFITWLRCSPDLNKAYYSFFLSPTSSLHPSSIFFHHPFIIHSAITNPFSTCVHLLLFDISLRPCASQTHTLTHFKEGFNLVTTGIFITFVVHSILCGSHGTANSNNNKQEKIWSSCSYMKCVCCVEQRESSLFILQKAVAECSVSLFIME